jgi:uncharacterized protein (TIGR00251 family)
MPVIQATDSGVLVRLRVQPRASTERLEGVHGDQLRMRLTAPPVEGAANTACIVLLAKTLGVRRSQVQIRSGARSRDKLIHIEGITPEAAAAALGVPSS